MASDGEPIVTGRRVVVVGAGIFGAAAALELRHRGWKVVLLDSEPAPAPLAASTDISKVVRREYGTDRGYFEHASEAIEIWRRWNAAWPEPLYHETGLLGLSHGAMEATGFEGASWAMLEADGCPVDRFDRGAFGDRFPAWCLEPYGDGFYHRGAGWAESGRVVARLVGLAREAGVDVRRGMAAGILNGASSVEGVLTADGDELRADVVVAACGAWCGPLLGLEWGLRATGHPVFHVEPRDPSRFVADRFPVFMADIANTGWYGFPLHPSERVVKIARHAAGRVVDPTGPREVTVEDREVFRDFLAGSIPELLEAQIVFTRLCLYADTADGHFWIDRDPERPGLVVATGGSGHGFKFAPLLGPWIADVVEGKPPVDSRFGWRRQAMPWAGEEEARSSAGPS